MGEIGPPSPSLRSGTPPVRLRLRGESSWCLGEDVKVRVEVTRRPEIADPQGTTIKRALHDLGHTHVNEVRVNSVFHLEIDGADPDGVRSKVEEMCRQLLANPVLEDFDIELLQ